MLKQVVTNSVVVLSCLGLVHCTVEASPSESTWTPADGLASVRATHGPVVTPFEGSFDAASHRLEVVYHLASGDVRTEAVLPYGTGPNQTYFHTVSVTWAGACGANTLCAQVQAVNNLTSPIDHFTVVFDTISLPSVVAVGAPWDYGSVASKTSSPALTWTFSDPTGANFTFKGHAEGVVTSASAVLSATPTAINLGTMPMEEIGSNSTRDASVRETIQNASGGGASGALAVTRATVVPEISLGTSTCSGSSLQPLATCADDYRLDCTTANGATAGAKSIVVTVTDPASATTATFTVTGTCMALIPECETYLFVDQDCLASQGDSGDILASEIEAARSALYTEAAKGATQYEATRTRCVQETDQVRNTCF